VKAVALICLAFTTVACFNPPTQTEPVLLTDLGSSPAVHGGFMAPSGSGPHPAVVVLHGSAGWKPQFMELAEWLSDSGFAVLVLDYYAETGGAAIGSEEKLRKWETWRQVVRDGAGWLRSLPNVDGDAIGLVGFSRGGFLAVSAGASTPGVTGIVEWYGGGGGGTLELAEEVHGLPPLLILHGEEDGSVPVSYAYRLEEAVKASGGSVEMQIYPGAKHSFNAPWLPSYSRDSSDDAYARTLEFLRANLDHNNVPVMGP